MRSQDDDSLARKGFITAGKGANMHRFAKALYDLERHMANGGDYWEFMKQRCPKNFNEDGTLTDEYKKLLILDRLDIQDNRTIQDDSFTVHPAS